VILQLPGSRLRIVATTQTWDVEKLTKGKWNKIFYCVDFKQAWSSLIEAEVRAIDSSDLTEIAEEIKKIKSAAKAMLDSLGLVCVDPPARG
jgi:hypothetical protein